MKKAVTFIFLFAFLATACGGGGESGAAAVAEEYVRALAGKDKAVITNLSCNEWEESAILEIDGLLSVDAEVSELSCGVTGTDGDSTLVVCNGSLDLTYNDEIRSIDLSRRTYYLQENDGQWQVCEYR